MHDKVFCTFVVVIGVLLLGLFAASTLGVVKAINSRVELRECVKTGDRRIVDTYMLVGKIMMPQAVVKYEYKCKDGDIHWM